MKMLLILVASILAVGCGGKFPPFPEIQKHYFIDLKCADTECNQVSEVKCVEFDIVSKKPYKISNAKVVELKKCQSVGGYVLKDMQLLLNWTDDVQGFFDNYKCVRK
ncbi:MAG: hypothetical protein ACK5RO_06655 [Pseudobdellovibrionaceae bacterium]|jgi:hypothetical protein